MKSFLELKNEVLRYFNLASEPEGAADVLMVGEAINTANQLRCTEDNWKFMLSGQQSLAVVVGTQEYVLPRADFHKIQYIQHSTTKEFAVELPIRSANMYGVGFNAEQNSGIPFYEILTDGSPLAVQPSSATTLYAVNETANGESQLYIEGEDSNGLSISETIDVANTGDVPVASTQSFAKVTYIARIGEVDSALGIYDSNDDRLDYVAANRASNSYAVIRWMSLPTEAGTWVYRYYRKPRIMERDYDRPDLPFPAANVLVYDALLSLATYNELDSESVNIWREKQQQFLDSLYLQKLEGNSVAGMTARLNEGND